MRKRKCSPVRRGVVAVEFVLVAPIACFLVLATMIGSQGVFCYHQVASLARDASRWAAVHGYQYQQDTGYPAATPEDVYNAAILPRAIALRSEHLTYQVVWNESNLPLQVKQDVQNPVGNTVTITVSYRWYPAKYLIGPINLTSSSTMQMIY
jgi:Flp pilus assembly protein TadG